MEKLYWERLMMDDGIFVEGYSSTVIDMYRDEVWTPKMVDVGSNDKVHVGISYRNRVGSAWNSDVLVGIVVEIEGRMRVVRSEVLESFYYLSGMRNIGGSQFGELVEIDGRKWIRVRGIDESRPEIDNKTIRDLFYIKMGWFRRAVVFAELNGNIHTLQEAEHVADWFYSIYDDEAGIVYSEKEIKKLREDISTARGEVLKYRRLMDEDCRECADALDELEEGYGIKVVL